MIGKPGCVSHQSSWPKIRLWAPGSQSLEMMHGNTLPRDQSDHSPREVSDVSSSDQSWSLLEEVQSRTKSLATEIQVVERTIEAVSSKVDLVETKIDQNQEVLLARFGRVPGPDREAVPGEPSRAARAGREVPDPAAESGSSWGWQCQEDGGVPETDPRLAGDCGGNEGRSVDTSRAHPQDLLCTLEKHCTRRICYCGVGFFQLAPQHDCWQTSRRGGLPIEPP